MHTPTLFDQRISTVHSKIFFFLNYEPTTRVEEKAHDNRNQRRIKLSDPYTFDAQFKLNWTHSSRTAMKCAHHRRNSYRQLCVARYGSGFTKTSRRDYRTPCAYSAKRNFGLISGYCYAALSLVSTLFWLSWHGIRRYVFYLHRNGKHNKYVLQNVLHADCMCCAPCVRMWMIKLANCTTWMWLRTISAMYGHVRIHIVKV